MNDSSRLEKNDDQEINLDDLYSALVECFFVIICGYATGKLNLISQREARGFDIFIRTFSLPSVIFLSLAQFDMSTVNWNFLGSILVSKSIVFIGVIVLTLFLARPIHFGKLGLYAVFCTQSNDFALGYPILNALYRKDHPNYPSYVYLLAPISLAVLNPIAYVFLEIGKLQSKDSIKINQIKNTSGIVVSEASNQNGLEESRIIRNNLIHGEEKSCERKSEVKLCGTVFLNIVTNPVMLMTVLGLIGNLFYHYIAFVDVMLNAFAKVFSTTALFALGIRMVGGAQKLKGNALITSGMLIITKLLVLPLITREVVSLLRTGKTTNETLDLSTFGFMYGTFPTAPMVFVLSSQYDLEIESISSSLIVCTFLSAPLMYISAKMIFLHFPPSDDYYQKLESCAFNVGIAGIPLGIWLLALFVSNKAFSKVPHKVTGFLIISQIFVCIGAALQPLGDSHKPWFSCIQFSFLAYGIYSSRIWAGLMAATLVLLQSRSLCFVIKLLPGFHVLAWGLPAILVIVTNVAAYPHYKFETLINMNLAGGKFQFVVSILLLTVSFFGTCICLILQHRYQTRFDRYLALVEDVNSKDLQEVKETEGEESCQNEIRRCGESQCGSPIDIEELTGDNKSTVCSGTCRDEDLCSTNFGCTKMEREICEATVKQYKEKVMNEDLDEDLQDRQIFHHVILLLLLVTSMFVNLMLSVWTMVVEDAVSGIYVELLFLNVILNVGQIFLTFGTFGFDSRSLVSSITNRWRRFYYGADCIILTPVEDLSFETTHVCDQFMAHHLHDCEKEIARNKRLRLRLYKDCFKGKTLVSWLQKKRLAKDEAESVQYASHLLEGRVLRHVQNRHHFENSNLLYTFRP